MKKIAFVTHIYTDSNFHSGGVKLNYILLNGLKKCNYTIDLYCNNVRNNVHNLFENIYKFDEIENNRANYDLILSDKACVPSDITYIFNNFVNITTDFHARKKCFTCYFLNYITIFCMDYNFFFL